MRFKFEGKAIIHFMNVEIEADSEEEAIRQLNLSLIENPRDALSDGSVFNGELVGRPEAEITETHYKVRCYDIDYDISESDLGDAEIATLAPIDWDDQDSIDDAIQEYKDTLNKEVVIEFDCAPDEFDDYCVDKLSDATGFAINNYKREILEHR